MRPFPWFLSVILISYITSFAGFADTKPNIVLIMCDDMGFSDGPTVAK